MVYENTEAGFADFRNDALTGLNDEEDIPEMWDELDIIGDYRMDFSL